MKKTIFSVIMVFNFLFSSFIYCIYQDQIDKQKIEVELLCWVNHNRKIPTSRFVQIPVTYFEELKVFIAHKVVGGKAAEITVSFQNEREDNPEIINRLKKCLQFKNDTSRVLNSVVDLTKLPQIYVYDKK